MIEKSYNYCCEWCGDLIKDKCYNNNGYILCLKCLPFCCDECGYIHTDFKKKMKEEVYKIDRDYLDFRLNGYRVIVLRIDNNMTGIEIRKGKKDKLIFSEKVKGGLKE